MAESKVVLDLTWTFEEVYGKSWTAEELPALAQSLGLPEDAALGDIAEALFDEGSDDVIRLLGDFSDQRHWQDTDEYSLHVRSGGPVR